MIICILFILLANPKVCLQGATAGMNLWLNTIFPTLLPFIIISNIILNVYSKDLKNPRLYVIFIGLCCGCPMAAMAASNLYEKGMLTKNEAESLVGICNNLSPAFIISYVFMSTLHYEKPPLLLLGAAYLPVVFLLAADSLKKKQVNYKSIMLAATNVSMVEHLDNAIMSGFAAIAKLGGYIILSNILAAYVSLYTKKHVFLNCILTSLTEITSGMKLLADSPIPHNIKCLIAGGAVAFGGLCCLFQTLGVISSYGLSIKKYIYYKIILLLLTTASYYLVVYVL